MGTNTEKKLILTLTMDEIQFLDYEIGHYLDNDILDVEHGNTINVLYNKICGRNHRYWPRCANGDKDKDDNK